MIKLLVLAALAMASASFAAPTPCDPGPQAIQEWKGYDVRHPQFRRVSSIAVAPSGSVFLLDHELYLIREFSPDGTFLKTWDLPEYEGEAMVAMAASDSFLYVSDGHCTFQIFKDGSIARWLRGAVDNGLATDQSGNLYVSTSLSRLKYLEVMRNHVKPDYYKTMHDSLTSELGIWKLNSDGRVVDHWAAPAWPITVHKNGALYGVEPDSGGAIFTMVNGKTGVLPCHLGLKGTAMSRSLAVSPIGHFFVNDYQKVVEIDEQGNVLRRWCDPGPHYDPLDVPGSLSVDTTGHLYVADYYKSRVLKFDLGNP